MDDLNFEILRKINSDLRGRDRTACQEEWGRAYDLVVPVARSVLAGFSSSIPEDEREELIIQAIHRVCRNISKITDVGHLKAEVAVVAANSAKDYLRHSKAQKRGGEVEHVSLDVGYYGGSKSDAVAWLSPKSPAEIAEQAERMSRLSEKIDALRQPHGKILWDRRVERLSVAEVAAKYGYAEGSVDAYVKLAKEELRSALQSDPELWIFAEPLVCE